MATSTPSTTTSTMTGSGRPRVFRRGDHGDGVVDIRHRLQQLQLLPGPRSGSGTASPVGVGADGSSYDEQVERAVRAFQQQRGLTADGVVDSATYRALDEAGWRLGDRVLLHLPGNLLGGDDVLTLQRRLLDLGFAVGRVDGLFGPATEQAVREFQRNVGIPPDGTCGPATLKALGRLAPRVRGGSPNALRSEERIRRAGPQLLGKTVVVDAAASNGVADPALRHLADLVATDLAHRVEGRLVATGVQAFLTRGSADSAGDEADRAQFANRARADLCVSLRVDGSPNPEASGVSSYFYGIDAHGVRSWAGERFAGLVQREIVARTGLADLRSHARSWDLLRLTRMPAVLVEVGYVTSPGDAAQLADPAFRDVVAEAVVVAVQRLYLAPEADPHTGVLRLGDLAALRENPAERAG